MKPGVPNSKSPRTGRGGRRCPGRGGQIRPLSLRGMAQDAAGRRTVCGGTRACGTDFGLIAAKGRNKLWRENKQSCDRKSVAGLLFVYLRPNHVQDCIYFVHNIVIPEP